MVVAHAHAGSGSGHFLWVPVVGVLRFGVQVAGLFWERLVIRRRRPDTRNSKPTALDFHFLACPTPQMLEKIFLLISDIKATIAAIFHVLVSLKCC